MWDYPQSRVEAVREEIHGRTIVDNYRWLEDGKSAEVRAWSKIQNAFSTQVLSEHTQVSQFKDELGGLFNFDGFGLPVKRAAYYYWTERKAGANQPTVFRKLGLDGDPEVILDVHGRRDDHTVSIAYWGVSPGGTYFAYVLSQGGTEMGTMYIRNMLTGEELAADTIPNCLNVDTCWLDDESGFFYSRYPEPGSVPKGEERYHSRVYRHEIGRSYTRDPLIFGEGRHKEESHGLGISDDRTILTISASKNWLENEIWLHTITTGETRWLIGGLEAKFGLSIVQGKGYLWTNYQAEFGRVLVTNIDELPASIQDWMPFIEQRDYKVMGTAYSQDYIIVMYLKDARSVVEVLDYQGKKQFDLKLPDFATFQGISCRSVESEFFYSFSTFLTPIESYRYDPLLGESVPYRAVQSPINQNDYIVKQEWYKSKDGTAVPMFLIHKKGIKKTGANPTLLYAYGGFGISQTPEFIRGSLPFVDRGGVYVIANIRGGGEYGLSWHKSGILANKQNSFDDFIAAAEYLIAQKYTNSNKLAIAGGSNGGLLVAAAMTQRPELFKAVICRVPLLDMVRFPKFLIASRWVNEYGDPTRAKDLDWIMSWSPYHKVAKNVVYPATLIMTGDKDARVEPLHARKMAALLQASMGPNPILIDVESEAGHGPGKPLNKWMDGQAKTLAFLAWQLEMST